LGFGTPAALAEENQWFGGWESPMYDGTDVALVLGGLASVCSSFTEQNRSIPLF